MQRIKTIIFLLIFSQKIYASGQLIAKYNLLYSTNPFEFAFLINEDLHPSWYYQGYFGIQFNNYWVIENAFMYRVFSKIDLGIAPTIQNSSFGPQTTLKAIGIFRLW